MCSVPEFSRCGGGGNLLIINGNLSMRSGALRPVIQKDVACVHQSDSNSDNAENSNLTLAHLLGLGALDQSRLPIAGAIIVCAPGACYSNIAASKTLSAHSSEAIHPDD